jgi:hypothetical protein
MLGQLGGVLMGVIPDCGGEVTAQLPGLVGANVVLACATAGLVLAAAKLA